MLATPPPAPQLVRVASEPMAYNSCSPYAERGPSRVSVGCVVRVHYNTAVAAAEPAPPAEGCTKTSLAMSLSLVR